MINVNSPRQDYFGTSNYIIMISTSRFALICGLLLLTLTNCFNKLNGNYIIYKITPFDPAVTYMPAGYNDSISNELTNLYTGKQFTIKQHDQYVDIEGIGRKSSLILAKGYNEEHGEIHSEKHTIDTTTFSHILRYDKKKNLILIVAKRVEQPKPAGYPRHSFDFSYEPNKVGLIICYLSKN